MAADCALSAAQKATGPRWYKRFFILQRYGAVVNDGRFQFQKPSRIVLYSE
jgi:hypothetical protein